MPPSTLTSTVGNIALRFFKLYIRPSKFKKKIWIAPNKRADLIIVESITIRKKDYRDVETIKKNNIMNLMYSQYNF